MHMNRAAIIAKGGLITGLCVLFLYLASVFPTGRLALLVCAGFLMMIAVIETSAKGAVAVFFAASLLGFFLLPQKWISLAFFLLFGLYPLIKKRIELIGHKGLTFGLKLLFLNIDILIIHSILTAVIGLPSSFSGWIITAGILASNGIFFLYDFLLALLFDQYLLRIYRHRGQS